MKASLLLILIFIFERSFAQLPLPCPEVADAYGEPNSAKKRIRIYAYMDGHIAGQHYYSVSADVTLTGAASQTAKMYVAPVSGGQNNRYALSAEFTGLTPGVYTAVITYQTVCLCSNPVICTYEVNDIVLDGDATWYLDADGDHYYKGSGIVQPTSPGEHYYTTGLLGGNDCNDNDVNVNPGAAEICGNNTDDNCNGQTDENCTELQGLEVTQVIQDWNNSMPLIEHKRTIVRAHLRSLTEAEQGFRPKLTVRRAGDPNVPASVLTASNVSRFLASAKTDLAQKLMNDRLDMNKCLYFEVPDEWTAGDVEFELQEGAECRETAGTANDCKVTVSFKPSKVMDLKFYNTDWAALNGTTHPVGNYDFKERVNSIEQQILSLYPVSRVNITYGRNFVPSFGDPVIDPYFLLFIKNNLALSIIRAMSPGEPANNIYMAIFDGPEPTSVAGLASWIPGNIASLHWKASETRKTGAHELGHLLGREHVLYCNATGASQGFPHDNEFEGKPSIGPMNKGRDNYIFGFNGEYNSPVSPEISTDLMSYCDFPWVSDFTYKALDEAINHGTRFTTVARPLLQTQGLGTDNSALPQYRLFSGIIDLDTDSVDFNPAILLPVVAEPTLPLAGTYALQLLDDQDRVIKAIDFAPSVLLKEQEQMPNKASFILPVSVDVPVKKAVIVKGTSKIHEKMAGTHLPTVKVIFPNGGETLSNGTGVIQWEGSDQDGDSLTYSVQFSKDGGASWQTLAINLRGTSYNADISYLEKTGTGMVRVLVSDGLNVARDESDGLFTLPNNAPAAFISTPFEAAEFTEDEPVFFRGAARDVEDGRLSGAALSWTSDLDGLLGNGETFFKPATRLTPGDHIISFQATDKDGASATSKVKIRIVRSSAPLPLSLTGLFGQMRDEDVLLNWDTENEVNTGRFGIERSSDGRAFESIGMVNAVNTAARHSYSFTDKAPWFGNTRFYRLKIIDNDEGFRYSDVIKIVNDHLTALTIYPNPADGIITVTGLSGRGLIKIYSIEGKEILRQPVSAQTQTLAVSRLPAGLYVLQYNSGTGVYKKKMIKK